MGDNTTKIDTILNIVTSQQEHIASIPEMKKDLSTMTTDIAVIKIKQEAQERRLSASPTDTEVDLKILKHADLCNSGASQTPKRVLSWQKLIGLIVAAALAALAAYFGG